MTEINQIYKCNICGNIIEVLHTGAGELVCCEKPMTLQIEKNPERRSGKTSTNNGKIARKIFVEVEMDTK